MDNIGVFYKLPIEEKRVYIKRNGQKEDWVFRMETDFSKGPLIDLSIPDMGGLADGFPKSYSQFQWMQENFSQNNEWFHWTFRKKAQYEKIMTIMNDNFQIQSISVSCESPYFLDKVLNYHPGEMKNQCYSLELTRLSPSAPEQEIRLWFEPNGANQIEIQIKGDINEEINQWWRAFLKDNPYIEEELSNQKYHTSIENYDKLLHAAARINPKYISYYFSRIGFEVLGKKWEAPPVKLSPEVVDLINFLDNKEKEQN